MNVDRTPLPPNITPGAPTTRQADLLAHLRRQHSSRAAGPVVGDDVATAAVPPASLLKLSTLGGARKANTASDDASFATSATSKSTASSLFKLGGKVGRGVLKKPKKLLRTKSAPRSARYGKVLDDKVAILEAFSNLPRQPEASPLVLEMGETAEVKAVPLDKDNSKTSLSNDDLAQMRESLVSISNSSEDWNTNHKAPSTSEDDPATLGDLDSGPMKRTSEASTSDRLRALFQHRNLDRTPSVRSAAINNINLKDTMNSVLASLPTVAPTFTTPNLFFQKDNQDDDENDDDSDCFFGPKDKSEPMDLESSSNSLNLLLDASLEHNARTQHKSTAIRQRRERREKKKLDTSSSSLNTRRRQLQRTKSREEDPEPRRRLHRHPTKGVHGQEEDHPMSNSDTTRRKQRREKDNDPRMSTSETRRKQRREKEEDQHMSTSGTRRKQRREKDDQADQQMSTSETRRKQRREKEDDHPNMSTSETRRKQRSEKEPPMSSPKSPRKGRVGADQDRHPLSPSCKNPIRKLRREDTSSKSRRKLRHEESRRGKKGVRQHNNSSRSNLEMSSSSLLQTPADGGEATKGVLRLYNSSSSSSKSNLQTSTGSVLVQAPAMPEEPKETQSLRVGDKSPACAPKASELEDLPGLSSYDKVEETEDRNTGGDKKTDEPDTEATAVLEQQPAPTKGDQVATNSLNDASNQDDKNSKTASETGGGSLHESSAERMVEESSADNPKGAKKEMNTENPEEEDPTGEAGYMVLTRGTTEHRLSGMSMDMDPAADDGDGLLYAQQHRHSVPLPGVLSSTKDPKGINMEVTVKSSGKDDHMDAIRSPKRESRGYTVLARDNVERTLSGISTDMDPAVDDGEGLLYAQQHRHSANLPCVSRPRAPRRATGANQALDSGMNFTISTSRLNASANLSEGEPHLPTSNKGNDENGDAEALDETTKGKVSSDLEERADTAVDGENINIFEGVPPFLTNHKDNSVNEKVEEKQVQGVGNASTGTEEASHIDDDSINILSEAALPSSADEKEEVLPNFNSIAGEEAIRPNSADNKEMSFGSTEYNHDSRSGSLGELLESRVAPSNAIEEADTIDDSSHFSRDLASPSSKPAGVEESLGRLLDVSVDSKEPGHIDDNSIDPFEELLAGSVEARAKAIEEAASGGSIKRRGRSSSARHRHSKMNDSSRKHEKTKRSKSGRREKHRHGSRGLGGSSRQHHSTREMGSSSRGLGGSSRLHHSTRGMGSSSSSRQQSSRELGGSRRALGSRELGSRSGQHSSRKAGSRSRLHETHSIQKSEPERSSKRSKSLSKREHQDRSQKSRSKSRAKKESSEHNRENQGANMDMSHSERDMIRVAVNTEGGSGHLKTSARNKNKSRKHAAEGKSQSERMHKSSNKDKERDRSRSMRKHESERLPPHRLHHSESDLRFNDQKGSEDHMGGSSKRRPTTRLEGTKKHLEAPIPVGIPEEKRSSKPKNPSGNSKRKMKHHKSKSARSMKDESHSIRTDLESSGMEEPHHHKNRQAHEHQKKGQTTAEKETCQASNGATRRDESKREDASERAPDKPMELEI